MTLAAVLFFVAGLLDGVYPGGERAEPLLSYVYALGLLNLGVAVWIARGSERGLVLRIVVAAALFFERFVSAFALGAKSNASIGVHVATAAIELVILLAGLRVLWLGRSLDAAELAAIFALQAWAPEEGAAPDDGRHPSGDAGRLPGRIAAGIAAFALALAASLVLDGALSGFVPDGRAWGFEPAAAGWLAYLFAVVVLAVSVRAVHGARFSLRLLLALSLLLLLERTLGPLLVGRLDVTTWGVHGVAAFFALALALSAVAGLRAAAAAERRGTVTPRFERAASA